MGTLLFLFHHGLACADVKIIDCAYCMMYVLAYLGKVMVQPCSLHYGLRDKKEVISLITSIPQKSLNLYKKAFIILYHRIIVVCCLSNIVTSTEGITINAGHSNANHSNAPISNGSVNYHRANLLVCLFYSYFLCQFLTSHAISPTTCTCQN